MADATGEPEASERACPIPPGGRGLPVLGETLEFLRGPREFFERRRARFGPVFTSRVLGMRLVTLVGVEANRWIFANEDKLLRNRWSYAIRRLLGADALSLQVGEAHRARRRVLAPHFRRTGLEPLVEPIAGVTREHLRRWAAAGGETVAVERFKQLAFEIAARYVFGEIEGLDLPRLSTDFDDWVQGMFVAVPVPLPGTRFGRAMAARRRLFAAIEAEVERRAGSSARGSDVLSTLLDVRDEHGRPLPRSTIVDEIQLLMFAGHDTTVTALTNIVLHLDQHPEVLARARAEQDAAGDAPLSVEGVRAMPWLHAVICESMRVLPPVGGAFRELTQDVEHGGFRLHEGWIVSMSPGLAHGDESVWTDPQRFDPERWMPGRAEHERHPFAWIPFGGGPRRCLGEHFAMLEMQLVLALLLRGYAWELVEDQDLALRFFPFPRPKSGLRLRLLAR
jgi:retinoid hydroxylase